MATVKKPAKKMQMLGGTTKAKKGGNFDLNKDGKTTFKDVLIGRGVLPKTAKKGMKVKKAQDGKTTPFQDYVKKYPGSGSDTLTSRNFDPRYNAIDDGYFGSKAKQNKDLKDAYSKTYVKKDMSRVSQKDQKKYRIQKTGGKTTASMMKKGGKMTKTCKYGCK
jgi:hypothetical protein